MDNLQYLHKLQELGVAFAISVPHQNGIQSFVANPEDLILLINDPVAIYAKHYGITKKQYLEWADSYFSVQCSGLTRKGRRCKNIVTGGSRVDARTWVSMQGMYCDIHSEKS